MPTAKDIEVALFYLQSECYKAGYPETGYLIEVARLSLEDVKRPRRAQAPQTQASETQVSETQAGNLMRLNA